MTALDTRKQTGWYTVKGELPVHAKTGANSMREHKLFKRLQAELRNGPEPVAAAPEQAPTEATPQKSKSAKRKQRRKRASKAQHEQAMQSKLAELTERFGTDYGN